MGNRTIKILIAAAIVNLLFITNMVAQSGSIQGKITGIPENEILFITLHSSFDSLLIKDTVNEANGDFAFINLNEGAYMIGIQQIGYREYWSEMLTVNRQTAVTLNIALVADVEQLGNVTVSSSKPFLQRKVDRLIVNPDAIIGNAASNALEVLEKTPGVLVDANGSISMKGKPGVVVFIDDKPTYLAAEDLAGFLKSIPGSNIDRIELMTNPPAHYDAAGNAGIINIKLKKNREKGINGNVNLGYGQGRYARTNNSVNINYRVNKFNFFGNLSFNQNGSYQDLDINRYYYNNDGTFSSAFKQNSYIKMNNGGRGVRLGFDYYATSRSTFGMVLGGFINPGKSAVSNNAEILNEHTARELLITSYSPSDQKWKNGSVNFNYNLKLDDKGREVTANADYIKYSSTHSQNLENKSYRPDGTLQSSTLLTSSLPADINIMSVKADYTQPLGKGRLDAGGKWSQVSTGNNALFYDELAGGVSTPNYEFTNQFDYKEMISAGYLNYSRDWDKISLQLGLRLENTAAQGSQYGNPTRTDSSFNINYTSLFPTLFVLYKMDSMQHNQLVLSMGRRIDRPNYKDLNPFTYPIDRYTFYGGNPFLKPTFSYNFELSHIFKNLITTTFEYSIAKDLIQETNEQRGAIYYSRPGNFGEQRVWGFSVNATIPVTKWWTLNMYSEAKNIAVNTIMYNQTIDEDKWYWYIGPTNQFKINSQLSAELAGSYQTSILVGQFLTIPVWQMRAGMAYNFLKGNATVRLNMSDLFYTNQPGGDIRNIANSQANWLSHLDSRVCNIGLTYRFNKGKGMQARKSGASDSEKDRVRMN